MWPGLHSQYSNSLQAGWFKLLSLWRQDLLDPIRPALRPTLPLIKWVPGVFFRGKSSRGVTVTTYPLLEPRMSMGGAKTPPPHCVCWTCYGTAFTFHKGIYALTVTPPPASRFWKPAAGLHTFPCPKGYNKLDDLRGHTTKFWAWCYLHKPGT